MNETRLGTVVAGSLSEGVAVRLDVGASVEDVVVGRYVTIQGKSRRFLGMITDVKLDASDQRMTFSPPDPADTFSAEVLSGTSAYGVLTVTPYLILGGDTKTTVEGPQPVKTIPSHFSLGAFLGSDMRLYSEMRTITFFHRQPAGHGNQICLNLPELVNAPTASSQAAPARPSLPQRWSHDSKECLC
jgi:hypothetical protein